MEVIHMQMLGIFVLLENQKFNKLLIK